MKASCPEVVGSSFVGCQQEATQDGLLGLQVVRWRRDFPPCLLSDSVSFRGSDAAPLDPRPSATAYLLSPGSA